MRRALAAALCVACGSRAELDAPGSPSTCATSSMKLPVESPWTDTGVDVAAGTTLVVHASGTVHYGGMAQQVTDPNGGNFDGTKFFPTTVYPSAPVCSVIGKIGGSTTVGTGTPVPGQGFVGADYDAVMTTSGRLFLGFNDQIGWFSDNGGAFDATISTCP